MLEKKLMTLSTTAVYRLWEKINLLESRNLVNITLWNEAADHHICVNKIGA